MTFPQIVTNALWVASITQLFACVILAILWGKRWWASRDHIRDLFVLMYVAIGIPNLVWFAALIVDPAHHPEWRNVVRGSFALSSLFLSAVMWRTLFFLLGKPGIRHIFRALFSPMR